MWIRFFRRKFSSYKFWYRQTSLIKTLTIFCVLLITFCFFTVSNFVSYSLNSICFSLDYFPQRKCVILAYFPCDSGIFAISSGKLHFPVGSHSLITLGQNCILFALSHSFSLSLLSLFLSLSMETLVFKILFLV